MCKLKSAVTLFVAMAAALCLSGCQIQIHMDGSFADISYGNQDKYSVGAAEISETVENIDIDWVAGSVTVSLHDADTVSFSEESRETLTDDTRLRYWLDGTTLRIRICGTGRLKLDGLEKKLTVMIPEELKLTELKVNSVSADISLDNVKTETAAVSTASGDIWFSDCSVTEFAKVSTISGILSAEFAEKTDEFHGSASSGDLSITAPEITRFKADTISGAVSLSVQTEPEMLDIDTTSGNIGLSLPDDASFTLDYDSTSGDLFSELTRKKETGQYVFGSGKGEYAIGTMSGNVRLTAVKQ